MIRDYVGVIAEVAATLEPGTEDITEREEKFEALIDRFEATEDPIRHGMAAVMISFLAGLFVGSEGTLGITLEAKVRLVELPRAKGLLVIHFTELLDALGATPDILTHGPSAVEVIDKYVLDSTRMNPEASRLRDFIQGEPAAILVVEFYADRADELPARLDALVPRRHARRRQYRKRAAPHDTLGQE